MTDQLMFGLTDKRQTLVDQLSYGIDLLRSCLFLECFPQINSYKSVCCIAWWLDNLHSELLFD